MPQFDPSVLADIGPNMVPDVVGSQAKALTLADLYDQNTMNKMKIGEAKQSQADMTYAKQILAGKDLTKLDDQNAAVAEITKRSPQLGMELMKSFQGGQKAQGENDLVQLELMDKKNDIIGGAIYPLKAKHDQILAANPNATPQQIHDAMQGDVLNTLQQLSQATLPNGKPVLNDQDRQFIQQNFGNGYNAQAVDTLVAKSKQAKDAIAMKMKERADTRAENRDERQAEASERQAAAAERAAKKAESEGEGKLDAEDSKFLAQQYLAGDKSVLTGLGRGAQGAKNVIAVRKAIREEAVAKGMKPEDVASRLAEYQGLVAADRKIGNIEGGVEFANAELEKMIPLALEASGKVSRSDFKPWTQLVQIGQDKLNSAPLRDLYVKTQSLLNAYDLLAARGGTDVAKREHNRQMLTTADSPEVYETAVKAIQQELNAARGATHAAMGSVSQQIQGGGSQPASTGNVIRYDAQGNRVQ